VFVRDRLDVLEVGSLVSVFANGENLHVVEGGWPIIDLKGKVGPVLFKNRMHGVGDVITIDAGDHLVADDFDGHRIPTVGFEVVGAFAVTVGEVRSGLVIGGLDVEVIGTDVDDRIVMAVTAREHADVLGFLELEVEAN